LHVSKKTDPWTLDQSQAVDSYQLTTSGVKTLLNVDTGRPVGQMTGQLACNMIEGRLLLGSVTSRSATLALQIPLEGKEQTAVVVRPDPVVRQHGCWWSAATRTQLYLATPPRSPCSLRLGEPGSTRLGLVGCLEDRLVIRLVIRLVDRDVASSVVTGVGVDPGSKFTGISVFVATPAGRVGLVAIEVRHRGQLAHKKMPQRSSYRRGCRSRNLRYGPARLDNRTRPKGWLAPNLPHQQTPLC